MRQERPLSLITGAELSVTRASHPLLDHSTVVLHFAYSLGDRLIDTDDRPAAPQGLEMIGSPGGPFWWPEADQVLFEALNRNLRPDIPVLEIDAAINDEEFSRQCTATFLQRMSAV